MIQDNPDNNSKYIGVPIKNDPILHDIAHIIAVAKAEYKSEYEHAKGIAYLALPGDLWGAIFEDLSRKLTTLPRHCNKLPLNLALNVRVVSQIYHHQHISELIAVGSVTT